MIEKENYEEGVEALKDLTKAQCSDGSWNYDPYMHGMANGLILALSVFEGEEPKFLEAPEVWLKDVPNDAETVEAVEGE